ncbi:MAG: anti-sigma factor [Caulobacteraceae bacterium]|nr:anti-sigma factor [Caulobacteraceae bacterium]
MIDDKTLLAYADGELEPSRAEAVERMLAEDPGLAAKLEQHRRLAAGLRAAYDPVLKEPVPERLARTAQGGGTVISLAEARVARAARSAPMRNWRAGGLIAAGLVGAIIVGQALWTPHTGPVAERAGRLVASGDLGRALDTELSGGESAVRVQLTFRDRAGSICRSFTGALAGGVACREDGHWALEALFPGDGQTGTYRMATSGDPRVLETVTHTMSGDPFDATQERAARARHWAPAPH